MKISKYSDYSNIIIPALLSVILFTITVFVIMLPHFETHIIEERKNSITNLSYAVYSYIDHYNNLVNEGKISLEEAQAITLDQIKNIRYGPEYKDFFWIHDMKVSMLMHPYRPDLVGKDLSNLPNPSGKNVTLETVKLVNEQGEGFIEYIFDRYSDSENQAKKLTFVKGYFPWGWIIGTGMYIDDVKVKIALVKRRMIYVFAGILVLVILLQSKLIRQNIKSDTKRSNAENELRKSESRFKELAELLPQMVFEMDLDGKVTFANRYAFEFTGYTSDDLEGGFNVSALFGKEDFMKVQKNLNKIIAGIKSFGSEYKLIKKNGETAYVHIYSNVIIHNDKPVGFRGIVIDITEYKRLQDQGQRAQRLEVAGRIAGQVAHDFNNLLAPLMAYPELIKKTINNDHPATQYINKIEIAAAYIAEINQQLLTLSRRGHYNQVPLNINEVVNNVIQQIQPLPSDITLKTYLEDNPFMIKGGAAQINRILLNLISNAAEAIIDGGMILVTTENHYQDRLAGINNKIPRGEYIKITISDTGPGIPSNVLPKIFDPFYTTKLSDRKKGSGLGLTVVHSIMEDHSGYIDYESKENAGTSFYLYFPITREKLDVTNQQQIIGGNESILVVDDDEMQREVTTKLLEDLGYKVMTADCGEKALKAMQTESFDLLILDMIMPGNMNGTETYREALKINTDQKAIIVSGFAENEQVRQALDLGAGAFIKKPLTLKSLAHAVRTELDSNENRLQEMIATKSVLG